MLPTTGGPPVLTLDQTVSTLVALTFAILPCLAVGWRLGAGRGWDWARVVAAAFALETAGVGMLALAAYYVGWSLTFVLAASGALFAAASAWALLYRRPDVRLASGWQGLAIAGAAAALAVYERPWFAQKADTFYHIAAARSLIVFDRPAVTDPLYGTHVNVLDPTSGVWQTLLALISRSTGIDVFRLWPGMIALGAGMTLLAFWVLAERVSGSRWAAGIATLGFLLVPLQLDMRWFGYPNRMALSVVFIALAAVVDLMRKPSLADAAVLLAASVSAIMLHLASAALIVLAAGLLGAGLLVTLALDAVRTRRFDWRPAAAFAGTGVAVAAVGAAVLLPKAATVTASPLVTYMGAQLTAQTLQLADGRWSIVLPAFMRDNAWTLTLATLLGLVAAIPALARGDRRALAVFGLCILPAALFANPPLTTMLLRRSAYLSSRVAILLRFPLYVGVAWGLAGLTKLHEKWSWVRAVAAGLALASLVLAIGIEWPLVRALIAPDKPNPYAFAVARQADVRRGFGPVALEQMREVFGRGYPVVAGDIDTTYYLAGLMPVAVAAAPVKHAPLAIEEIDGAARRRDMDLLLNPRTPEDIRREVLDRRSVSYVVVAKPTWQPDYAPTLAALRDEPDLFTPVVEGPMVVLFRVRR